MNNGKRNCWEFKDCGRHPGGRHIHEFGICPAATDSRLDGIHGGTNAGRACWVIPGTLCKGEVHGPFVMKYKNCSVCDFYEAVRKEEYPGFRMSAELLDRIR